MKTRAVFLIFALCYQMAAAAANNMYLVRNSGDVFALADTEVLWLTSADLKTLREYRLSYLKRVEDLSANIGTIQREISAIEEATMQELKIVINAKRKQNSENRIAAETATKAPTARIGELKSLLDQRYEELSVSANAAYQKSLNAALAANEAEMRPVDEKAITIEHERVAIGQRIVELIRKLSRDENYPINQFMHSEDPSIVATLLTPEQALSGKYGHLMRKAYGYTATGYYAPYLYPRINIYSTASKNLHKLLDELIANHTAALECEEFKANLATRQEHSLPRAPTNKSMEAVVAEDATSQVLLKEHKALSEHVKAAWSEVTTDAETTALATSEFNEQWEKTDQKRKLDTLRSQLGKIPSDHNERELRIATEMASEFLSGRIHQIVRTNINGEFSIPSSAKAVLSYYRNSQIEAQIGWFSACEHDQPISFKNSNGITTDSASLYQFSSAIVTEFIRQKVNF